MVAWLAGKPCATSTRGKGPDVLDGIHRRHKLKRNTREVNVSRSPISITVTIQTHVIKSDIAPKNRSSEDIEVQSSFWAGSIDQMWA